MVCTSFSGKRDSDYRCSILALAGQGGGPTPFQCIPSWGMSWALLTLILPHIFGFAFKIDFPWIFLTILDGFWEDFGRAKSLNKLDFGCFGGYDVREINFGRIFLDFDKLMAKKTLFFWLFLVSLLVFFLTFET